MRIYISGKITGLDFEEVKQKFTKVEEELKSKGYEVVNPVKIAEVLPALEWNEYISIDLKILDLCDGIYMLKDWEKSRGAMLEHKHAAWTNKRIDYEKVENF